MQKTAYFCLFYSHPRQHLDAIHRPVGHLDARERKK